jgi:hypothetical protein
MAKRKSVSSVDVVSTATRLSKRKVPARPTGAPRRMMPR